MGKEPGYSKVSQAKARSHIQLVGVKDLRDAIADGGGATAIAAVKNTAQITNFSSGYRGNSVALRIAGSTVPEEIEDYVSERVSSKARGSAGRKRKRDLQAIEDA